MLTNTVQVCHQCHRSILREVDIRMVHGGTLCRACAETAEKSRTQASIDLIMQQPDTTDRLGLASALLVAVGALGMLLHAIQSIGGKPVYFHLPSLPLSILLLIGGCVSLVLARRWRRERHRQLAERIAREAAAPTAPCPKASHRWRSL